jgi:hypothetical protein
MRWLECRRFPITWWVRSSIPLAWGFLTVVNLDWIPWHQGREFIANGPLENGAFCTVFSENFHKF